MPVPTHIHAVPRSEPILPTHPDDPHRYDLVHDAYGPGTFAAWLLGTYAILLQLFFIPKDHTNQRALDKDLFITLSYPVFAAGHLIKLVSQYPGPREKTWWTTSRYLDHQIIGADLQAAMPIQAAYRVCFAGLAVNIAIAFRTRNKWQCLSSLIASLWIFVCLVVASYQSGLFYGTFGGAFMAAYIIVAMPQMIRFGVAILKLTFGELILLWYPETSTRRGKAENFRAKVTQTVLVVLFDVFLVCSLVFTVGFMLICLLMPESGHSLFEIFQFLALTVGIVNAGLSVRDGVREEGPGRDFWKEMWSNWVRGM